MKNETRKRPYRQTARAEAAEATAERILDAFAAALRDRWFDEITLAEIAAEAGVAVQTVIRRFGSKEGLLEGALQRIGAEIDRRRAMTPGDARGAVAAIAEDYERTGDLVIRCLGQEERHAPLRRAGDIGRASHRASIGVAFGPWLEALPEPERRRAHDALVVATDVYVWKLVRRDMGRPKAELRALMTRMSAAALGLPETDLLHRRLPEPDHA